MTLTLTKTQIYQLKYLYGISEEQYNELWNSQNGKCAICDKHSSEFKKRLFVDHNHKTGEIRGLVCGYCNKFIIGRNTDSQIIRKLADYLDLKTGWFVPKKKKRRKRGHPRNT